MITAFLSMPSWKKFIDIALVVALIAGVLWIYLALVHRAEQIDTLTAENGQLSKIATDNAAALAEAQAQEQRTTAALAAATKQASDDASLAGQLKERISHAPKNGCIGPAERALLDGLRTNALNRSEIRDHAAP